MFGLETKFCSLPIETKSINGLIFELSILKISATGRESVSATTLDLPDMKMTSEMYSSIKDICRDCFTISFLVIF